MGSTFSPPHFALPEGPCSSLKSGLKVSSCGAHHGLCPQHLCTDILGLIKCCLLISASPADSELLKRGWLCVLHLISQEACAPELWQWHKCPTTILCNSHCYSWGCLDKILQTGGFNNKFFFLTVLQVGKSSVRAPSDLFSDEGPLPGLQMAALYCVFTELTEKAPQCLFVFGTNHIMETPPSWPHLTLITSQKPISKYHHHFGS